MDRTFYFALTEQSIAGGILTDKTAREILTSQAVELLPLLQAAYEVRKKFTGNDVMIHILNNAQNGHCPEDCHYCVQAKTSKAEIHEYPLKSDDEILAEARHAYEKGAYRYCMVFSGRGPSLKRLEHLSRLIRKIKSIYPLEICVSAGLLDEEKAVVLKNAGLDRLNHNLNTSQHHYPQICTTHAYTDRIGTLKAARGAGIGLCSGVIIGMGETAADVVEVALTLRAMNVESIPVNFFMPLKGVALSEKPNLTPEYCLRVLCLYRFLNPKAEIRIAAGREFYLGSMEVMALYPANSLFLDGYLNAQGKERLRTLKMIQEAGFTVRSNFSLEDLLQNEEAGSQETGGNQDKEIPLKDLSELRPCLPAACSSAPKKFNFNIAERS